MLRFIFAAMFVVAAVIGISESSCFAQNAQPAPQVDTLPPQMEALLSDWARASAKIERLEGQHLRRVYDMTFEVEKLSKGKFYFQFPDKGRIDVQQVVINDAMRLARQQNIQRIQKKKNGQPFALESDREEKWICDGMKVYSIDEGRKHADIVQLPPDLQGTNIMDSPLPFLFGMPPEKAKRRFALSFSRALEPASGFAHLTALPRLPQDAQSWSKAEVILDLKTFLPYAVRLTDPAETKITVFEFSDMKANHRDWLELIPGLPKAQLFEPDLRGYHVDLVGDGNKGDGIADRNNINGNAARLDQPRMTAERPPVKPAGESLTVPNLVGRDWSKAVELMEGYGFRQKVERNRILLLKGSPATRGAQPNTVEKQDPAPGTPINADTNIQLWIYLDSAAGK